MTKELEKSEALKLVEKWYGFLIADNDAIYSEYKINDAEHQELKEEIYKEYNIIKQELLKTQEQENFLDDMLGFNDGSLTSCFDYKEKQIVAMPLNVYNEFMEQEKALKIMFEKNVNIFQLRMCNTLDEYNARPKEERLTEEEFELLKRYQNEY